MATSERSHTAAVLIPARSQRPCRCLLRGERMHHACHLAAHHTHTRGESQNTNSEASQILRSTYCVSSFLGSLWRGKNSLAWGNTLRQGGRKYMKGSPQGTFWVIRFSTLIGVWITWGHTYVRTHLSGAAPVPLLLGKCPPKAHMLQVWCSAHGINGKWWSL